MIGYSTLYKSMNGIKILSDGVSTISDGQAQHESIIYNDYIYSDDGKTQLTNNKVKTENVECTNFDADNIMSLTIDTNSLKTKYLVVDDNSNNDLFIIDGITNNKITANIPMDIYEPLTVIDCDIHQTQTGRIYQQGTNNNYLKDTYINGYLQIGSNLTQSGGSSSLKDLTIDNLTMRTDKSITQTGNNLNSFGGTSTMKNLIITDSILLPSNINIPSFSTNDDIVMQTDSVIIQDITTNTTNTNILRDTKTQDLTIDGDITQIKGNGICILKNTTIQGTSELQGDITQTAGTTILKTLRCNNITLNDDQTISQSGTGQITQSGTGQNILKEISLLSNSNLIFNGSGIISQPLNGINILSHYRTAGFGIVGGRNNTTYTNYQNIQNNNGLQLQFNRDNSTQYSFIMNNRGTGGNGGFRFQRYIGGVFVDEPLIIDDTITMNKNLALPSYSLSCSSATIGNISQAEINCLDNCTQNINDKFTSLDNQITAINNTNNSVNSLLSGFSYSQGSDTTVIDNNLTINYNGLIKKELFVQDFVGTSKVSKIFHYDSHFYLHNTTNNGSLILRITNNAGSIVNAVEINDTNSYFYRDVRINAGKKLYIGNMDVEAEINALDTSFTTGTINSTNLTTTNLTVSNTATINNLTVSNTTTTNNLTVNNALTTNTNTISNKLTNTNVFTTFQNSTEPTFTFTKVLGTTNIVIGQFVIPSNYNKKISGSSPISIIRAGSLNNAGNMVYHFDTLESVQIIVLKNGVSFNTNAGIGYTDTLPITKEFRHIGNPYSYQQYYTNVKYAFTPTINTSSTDTYTIVANVNYSYYYTASIFTETLTNFGYYFNTDVSGAVYSGSTIVFFINPNGSSYSSSSFSSSSIGANLFSGSGQIQANDIICNNIYTSNTNYSTTANITTANITTGNITTANITTGNITNINSTTVNTSNLSVNNITSNCQFDGYIRTKSNIAGYLINGASYFESMPILCSVKGVLPDNNDDYYFVNAGYKLELYRDGNYGGGLLQTLDNTNSFSPQVFDVINKNTTSSIKVYYLNSEITYPYIS